MAKQSVDELQQLFGELDTDHSGAIKVSEIEDFLRKKKLPPAYARHVMQHADANHDGVLTFAEFKSYLQAKDKDVRAVFNSLDLDGCNFFFCIHPGSTKTDILTQLRLFSMRSEMEH